MFQMIKLEKVIFYVFLFSIPFQTRIIVWQWSKPFNEWTAGYIYLTDILLAGLLALWLIRSLRKKAVLKLSAGDRLIIVFLVISAFSIFNSRIIGLSFYRLAKLGEFTLLYFYLKANLGGMIGLSKAAGVVVGSGVFQAVIAIGQYLKQGSIGLKIFGESYISSDIADVAVFTAADGNKYLRAYGTTPHANVLAAWLFLAIMAFYFLYFRRSRTSLFDKQGIFILCAYSVLLFGFAFTFSRVMAGIWVLALISGLWFLGRHKKELKVVFITTILAGSLFGLLFWPQVLARISLSADEEAVTQRIHYNQIAGRIAKSHPLGIGIGQFTADLMADFKHYPANFYQPAHNIYFLILAETGFAGLAAFFIFTIIPFFGAKFGRYDSAGFFMILAPLFLFLIAGLFDHFLWTLQPGSLILWLVLAASHNLINTAVDS